MSSNYIISLLLNYSFCRAYSMTIYCRSIAHVILQLDMYLRFIMSPRRTLTPIPLAEFGTTVLRPIMRISLMLIPIPSMLATTFLPRATPIKLMATDWYRSEEHNIRCPDWSSVVTLGQLSQNDHKWNFQLELVYVGLVSKGHVSQTSTTPSPPSKTSH